MKYASLLGLIIMALVFFTCKTPPPTDNMGKPVDSRVWDQMWKTIDSLEQKGLTSSALDQVRQIKTLALQENESGQLVKSLMYENRYLTTLEEDSEIRMLARLEAELPTYPEPARSVMHSMAAQWYRGYQESRLWELRNRTDFTGPGGDDIRTWGIRQFIDRINAHYRASVQWEGLKTAQVEQFKLLLTDDQNTDHLRPTLFDILMHRALDYFTSAESELTAPEYSFVLTDIHALDPAGQFIRMDLATADTLSHTYQALVWYQQLLQFRLDRPGEKAALLDSELKRLQYVHQELVADGKDSIYRVALEDLLTNYADVPEVTLIYFRLAELLMQQASEWNPDGPQEHRFAYNEALAWCERAIELYPESHGAKLCQNLVAQIQQPSISAEIESVVLPNENILVHLDYRNLSAVHLKLVRLPEAPRRWRGERWDSEEILRQLLRLPEIRKWEQEIQTGDDHQHHQTEIPVNGLGLGHYALVIANDGHIDPNTTTTGVLLFTVSELGYWYVDQAAGDRKAAIINRKTGQPEKDVVVEFYTYEYNAALRQREEMQVGKETSDASGWVNVPAAGNKSVFIVLKKGSDEFCPDDNHYTYRSGEPQGHASTLFFSDRAIYRPGQRFYFKGYALQFDQQQMPSIVAQRNISVTLYDANGQEVTKQSFRTNEFGTFSGHFDLPASGLTGQMSITSNHGSNRYAFQVEEYKRPKFEVQFEPLKSIARLDEDITVVAFAKDYAGSAVSGGQVSYRVERVAYQPWWWGYWRSWWPGNNERQVVATGNLITAADGRIEIEFPAKSKANADPQLQYNFEITVMVTDLTGESHEAVKTIPINKQGYQVSIALAETISSADLKRVNLSASNSENQPVNVSGMLRVVSLQGPSQHKRERLWLAPDLPVISDADYSQQFPAYFQPTLEKRTNWPEVAQVGTRNFTVKGSTELDLSTTIRNPGFYKLEWTMRDSLGHELPMEQIISVYDPAQPLPGYEVMKIELNKQMWQPSDDVEAGVYTGLETPPAVLRLTDRRHDGVKLDWVQPRTSFEKVFTVNETDRGGARTGYYTVYNNRFYQYETSLAIPWTNKQLDVRLTTWRDKMEPGDEESWTITVSSRQDERVMAELLMSMYDASLDAFIPHEWSMSLFPSYHSRARVQGTSPRSVSYWGLTWHWNERYVDVPARQYRDIQVYGFYPVGRYYMRSYSTGAGRGDVMLQEAEMAAPPDAMQDAVLNKEVAEDETLEKREKGTEVAPALRKALDETVFFYPQMSTDAEGRVTFNFKMKEALTRWKFQALAHTKLLAHGLTSAEVVTQKKLMVFPNPPRFFREGDTIAFQAKLSNLTETMLSGNATLKILDAISGEDVSSKWNLINSAKSFSIKANVSSAVDWTLIVPGQWTRPVKYQVSAAAGEFTDGEEAWLPVVTKRVLMTETLPLPMKANSTKTFVFQSMLDNRTATTVDHQFTIEMTSSPAWYAVQALPFLMEYPYECAEQVFNRYYANILAKHITDRQPQIREVYETWRQYETDALVSPLFKNQELKTTVIEETPWVRDALAEDQQRKDIALLFEENRLRYETQNAIDKLAQMQLSNGGFPWFAGGRDHWYITQYIVEGLGHLQKLGIPIDDPQLDRIIERAIPYIDSRMSEWYAELEKRVKAGKAKWEDHHISSVQVHYIYARSFFPEIQHQAKMDPVLNYVKSQMETYWLKHGLYDQGMMALGYRRTWPADKLADEIVASLRERTIYHEELGRYWKTTSGYWWNEAVLEMQAMMVELYQESGIPQAEIDELRVWLLKQKQTRQWKTTKATSAAIYALLIHPDAWLSSVGMVEVTLGKDQVIDQGEAGQAGTGYVKKSWNGDAIKTNWSTIDVENPNNHIAWGSAYWQYWEDLDKVKSEVSDNPLKISREIWVTGTTDRGEEGKVANLRKIKVGDKLVVRLVLETDRPMEFVHIKDRRASGFEPMDVISGYRWKGGLGYYQNTRDLSTNFFIDYLPRGKYVLEYNVTVAQAGKYSDGLAEIQCMYAPEFAAHTAGQRIEASW